MDNKVLKKGYIEFIGTNATEVTGSANLVRFLGYHILVDYGLRQSSKDKEDYQINSKRHKDVKPKKIDAIILTHCHLDHSGRIPQLYKDGATCPIYVEEGSKKILTIMWQDCVKIFANDYEKYDRVPLYSQHDVDNALAHIVEVKRLKKFYINSSIAFQFYGAQHIVKSNQILLFLNNGINEKKIAFTGDWSNYKDTFFVNGMDKIKEANIVVAEATYGDRPRKHHSRDRKTDVEKFKTAINYALEHKTKVVVPVFSLHRLQSILAVLYEMYEGKSPIRILVDSPLGKSVSNEWEYIIDKDLDKWKQIQDWECCHWTKGFKDTLHFSEIKEPMLILAGGAFLQGGRATYWVKKCLPSKHNFIIFCGYSTPESPAGMIKSGKLKEIKIDGEVIKNRANIVTLNSFSSHADKNMLIEYYTEIMYQKLCINHANYATKCTFAADLKEALSKKNRTSKVVAVQSDTKIYIN